MLKDETDAKKGFVYVDRVGSFYMLRGLAD
jgi:hypothetical protein